MSSPPQAPALPVQQKVEELEYQGNRLREELATLQKMEAVHTARADECDAAIVDLTKAFAVLPADADARTVFDAKSLILAAELNRGLAFEEKARLQDELLETPKLIAAKEKQIAKAKADIQ
jgi:hypothetical protein